MQIFESVEQSYMFLQSQRNKLNQEEKEFFNQQLLSYFNEGIQKDTLFKKKQQFEENILNIYSDKPTDEYENNFFFIVKEQDHLKQINYQLSNLNPMEKTTLEEPLSFQVSESTQTKFFCTTKCFHIKTDPMNWTVSRSLSDFDSLVLLLNSTFPFQFVEKINL